MALTTTRPEPGLARAARGPARPRRQQRGDGLGVVALDEPVTSAGPERQPAGPPSSRALSFTPAPLASPSSTRSAEVGVRAPNAIDPASRSGTMACARRASGRKASGMPSSSARGATARPRVGADHGAHAALRARGGVVHLAFELEAEALVARDPQQRQPQPAALELDLHADVTVDARGGDELPGAEADEGVGLRAAPAGLGRAGLLGRIGHRAGAARPPTWLMSGPCRTTSKMSPRLDPAGMKARASSCGPSRLTDTTGRPSQRYCASAEIAVPDRSPTTLRAAARPAAIDSCARTPNVPSPFASNVTAPAVAQPRKRTRLVPRRPILPSNTGASGGPETAPCSSPRLPPGRPRRSSSITSLSCERASARRSPLTASRPTLAWSMEKVARERLSAGSRSRRPTARGTMLSSGPASSLAPAMRSRSSQREARLHLHRQSVPPRGLELAGDELGPPVLLERQRQIGERRARRVGADGGPQVERRPRPCPCRSRRRLLVRRASRRGLPQPGDRAAAR